MPESSKARDLSWDCTAALQGGRDSSISISISMSARAGKAAISNQHHDRTLSSRRPCSDIFRPPTPDPTAQAPWPCGRTPASMPGLQVAGAQVPLRQAHLFSRLRITTRHSDAEGCRRCCTGSRWTSMHGGSPEALMRQHDLVVSSVLFCASGLGGTLQQLCTTLHHSACTVPPSSAISAGGGGYF